MSPKKALELVERYARLTKVIKACRAKISESLEGCRGFSGKRNVLDAAGCFIKQPDLDAKNRDQDLHLTAWYSPGVSNGNYYDEPHLVWEKITDKHKAECPHCYAAHLAIQERKEARKQLAGTKSAMSRVKVQP